MVFISYSHKDRKWFDAFKAMSKPLQKYVGLEFWSDKEIKPSADWEKEINQALNDAEIAVLLVSVDFLASDFIANVELPKLLEKWKAGKLELLWIPLTPSHYKLSGLPRVQAVSDPATPLNSMSEYAYQAALYQACDRIDAIVLGKEKPVINKALNRQRFDRIQKKLQVLSAPAMRDTHVLLQAGGKWYTQGKIPKGGTTCDIWVGDDKFAKPGDEYKLVAITRKAEENLKSGVYDAIPEFRTKSDEITLVRK